MKLSAFLLPFIMVLIIMTSLTASAPSPDKTSEPDSIFINGDIYPGAVFQPGPHGELRAVRVGERAHAMAVRAGRIAAMGTTAEISKLKGAHTKVVDLGRHFVMPGFNDAHIHLAHGGIGHLTVDLIGTTSLEDMKARIVAHVKTAAPGEWIMGRGWDESKWTSSTLPTRQDIDSVTAGHPAYLIRIDGHSGVANTAALRVAGITRQTPDPVGGKVVRDAQGEANGILRDTASHIVLRLEPDATPAQRRRAMELALAEAAQWGLTSAQDNSEMEYLPVLEELRHSGKLTLRITEWLPFDEPVAKLEVRRAHLPATDLWLRAGQLKGYMDGSLGSHSAALLAPYSDDVGNSGLPRYEQAKLNAMVTERALAGFQMGFHAIGDRGSQMALNAFAEGERAVRERHPGAKQDFRFRVEHAQVVTASQLKQYHDLGVIASMQPCHLLTDMNWAMDRLGPQRAAYSYTWFEFLRSGVMLAFGTDYPVEPITPFRGIYVAVTRKNEAGTKEYFPEKKLDIDAAIAGYTSGAAYAEFSESDKGTLQPGKLADFVVLDRDLTKVSPPEILKTRVLRTVVGGKTVWEGK